MSEMKLTYFNARGRAELTRLLFAQAGKKYVDCRLTGDEFKAMKDSTLKGQLPILEVDGQQICESMAIARHVARETGLYGSSNCEATACDMVIESCNEVINAIIGKMFRAKTEEEKAAADEKIHSAVGGLNKVLVKVKGGKFLLGEKASIGDAAVFSILEYCKVANIEPNAECTAVREVEKNFAEQECIANYLKSRPETQF